ncbi:MAG TPA: YceI family protein [Ktedonobacteraceae bacterium]|nr:YceI family protein [Ktedonobacteraceae bacterium]
MAWNIDPTHSQVTFSVKHMMVSTVKGNFKVFGGKLEIDEANPQNSWVEAEADTGSIDTRDANRDKHLRSADFFDSEQYPEITFKSKKIEPVSNDEYRVLGDLTIHGVTREVLFKAEYAGQLKDGYGKQRAGLSAKAAINRKDFGLTWNKALETGGVAVSDKVVIEIDLAAVKED